MYIVHHHYHYDHYKRSESKSFVEKIYENKEDAYNYCVEKLLVYFKEYTTLENLYKKKYDDDDEDEDENKNTKILYNNFKDKKTNIINRYNLVLNNFEIFFGEPEFSILPTHDMWYITEKELN